MATLGWAEQQLLYFYCPLSEATSCPVIEKCRFNWPDLKLSTALNKENQIPQVERKTHTRMHACSMHTDARKRQLRTTKRHAFRTYFSSSSPWGVNGC